MKLIRVFSFLLMLAMLLSNIFAPVRIVSASTSQPDLLQSAAKGGVSIQPGNASNPPLVKKVPDSGTVNANDPIGFMLVVTNNTPNTMTNVVLRDQLDPAVGWTVNNTDCTIDDTGLLYCLFSSLPAGWTYQVHISATSTPDMCGVLTNTVEAYSDQTPLLTSTASITILCQPDVTITKTEESPSIVSGDVARYVLEVRNTGTGQAEEVVVQDNLPSAPGLSWTVESISDDGACQVDASVLTCHFSTLERNGVRTIVISSPTTAAQCGDITNTASVSAANEDSTRQGNNSDSGVITVYCTTLRVEKIADDEQVNANEAVGFTITVSNTGATVARNVTVSDALPAGVDWNEDGAACSIAGGLLSCSFGDVAAGGSASVHITGMSSPAVCGIMTNTAVAQAANNPSLSQDTATILINCAPRLSVTKVAEKEAAPAGTPISYTITASNIGSAPAHDVTITDPLSSGLTWTFGNVSPGGRCGISDNVLSCSFGTLGAGQSASVRVSTVSSAQTCGYLVNTVTAQSSNAGVVSDIAAINVICGVNVKVTKVAERAEVAAGDNSQPARFIITVTNNGVDTATGVTLSDPLPTMRELNWRIDSVNGGGTCSLAGGNLACNFGNLSSGQTRVVIVSSLTGSGEFCAPGTTIDGRTIPNTATVVATNEPAEAMVDNSAYASIRVICRASACESPDEVYFNNFNNAAPGLPYWSSSPISTSPNGTQTFLGEFGNEDLHFTYPDTNPDGHQAIKVSFDLYIIRSWDGNTTTYANRAVGPDHWQFKLLNEDLSVARTIINTTFTNYTEPSFLSFRQAFPQSYPVGDNVATAGAAAVHTLGYQFAGPRDATYHFSFTYPHTDNTVNLSFSAFGLQSLVDESWGIDNFELRLMRCNAQLDVVNYLYLPLIANSLPNLPLDIRRDSLPDVPLR